MSPPHPAGKRCPASLPGRDRQLQLPGGQQPGLVWLSSESRDTERVWPARRVRLNAWLSPCRAGLIAFSTSSTRETGSGEP